MVCGGVGTLLHSGKSIMRMLCFLGDGEGEVSKVSNIA